MSPNKCACGCGSDLKSDKRRYIRGHLRAERWRSMLAPAPPKRKSPDPNKKGISLRGLGRFDKKPKGLCLEDQVQDVHRMINEHRLSIGKELFVFVDRPLPVGVAQLVANGCDGLGNTQRTAITSYYSDVRCACGCGIQLKTRDVARGITALRNHRCKSKLNP